MKRLNIKNPEYSTLALLAQAKEAQVPDALIRRLVSDLRTKDAKAVARLLVDEVEEQGQESAAVQEYAAMLQGC